MVMTMNYLFLYEECFQFDYYLLVFHVYVCIWPVPVSHDFPLCFFLCFILCLDLCLLLYFVVSAPCLFSILTSCFCPVSRPCDWLHLSSCVPPVFNCPCLPCVYKSLCFPLSRASSSRTALCVPAISPSLVCLTFSWPRFPDCLTSFCFTFRIPCLLIKTTSFWKLNSVCELCYRVSVLVRNLTFGVDANVERPKYHKQVVCLGQGCQTHFS